MTNFMTCIVERFFDIGERITELGPMQQALAGLPEEARRAMGAKLVPVEVAPAAQVTAEAAVEMSCSVSRG